MSEMCRIYTPEMRIKPENPPWEPDDLFLGLQSHKLSTYLEAWKGDQVLLRISSVSGAFTCVTLLNPFNDLPKEVSYPHLYR